MIRSVLVAEDGADAHGQEHRLHLGQDAVALQDADAAQCFACHGEISCCRRAVGGRGGRVRPADALVERGALPERPVDQVGDAVGQVRSRQRLELGNLIVRRQRVGTELGGDAALAAGTGGALLGQCGLLLRPATRGAANADASCRRFGLGGSGRRLFYFVHGAGADRRHFVLTLQKTAQDVPNVICHERRSDTFRYKVKCSALTRGDSIDAADALSRMRPMQ